MGRELVWVPAPARARVAGAARPFLPSRDSSLFRRTGPSRVEVDPPIDDAGYRRKFLDQMFQFQFNPARTTDGRPVSGHVVIPITL